MGGLRTTLRLVLLGGPIFYLFHVCTRWFYYLLTVDMGGAQYRASGRGFIIGEHAPTVKTPSHIHLSVPCRCCRARDLPQHVSAVRSITLCSWHGALVRARGPVHPRSHWVRASAPSAICLGRRRRFPTHISLWQRVYCGQLAGLDVCDHLPVGAVPLQL